MATQVLITIDTELLFSAARDGLSADDNLAISILGRTPAGDFGIAHQMDRLEAHGLIGVFFVDPLPALVYGPEVVARIVGPIVARGHETQLHIHSEWLELASTSPVGNLHGRNIRDFPLDAQERLIGLARDLLIEAGAPTPVAFRAGNFGANDDTLRALARLGIGYDSSLNASYLGRDCRISLPPERTGAVDWCGVREVPVAGIFDRPGQIRPAQLCALSAGEMGAALDHAAASGAEQFVILSHSFELLSRDRLRPNRMLMRRFDALCRAIAGDDRLESTGFADLIVRPGADPERLPANRLRTLARAGQQALGRLIYERP